MATQGNLPPKKDVARALLLRGSLFVHLDPRTEAVCVPQWLQRQPQLVLQVGLDMPIPIPDLRVDDEGVFGTLSFNRSPHTCMVPWEAVFALVGEDGRGMVWPESMPEEIAAEVEREAGRREPAAPELESADEEDGKVVSLDARRPRHATTRPVTRKPHDAPDSVPPAPTGGADRHDADRTPVPQPQPLADSLGEELGLGGEGLGDDEAGSVDDDEEVGPRGERETPAEGRERPGKRRRRDLPPYLRVVK